MATVYYPQFVLVRISAAGVRSVSASTTITATNVTASSSLGTLASNSAGNVVQGSFTATAGDIVEFTHATYPGKCRFTLNADQKAAYYENVPPATFVLEDLSTAPPSDQVELWAQDTDNPNTEPFLLGVANADSTFEVSYQTNVAKTLDIFPRSKMVRGGLANTTFDEPLKQTVDIPATGGTGGGQLFYFNTDRSSTTTGLDLYSGEIPANTLSANGDVVRAKFAFKFAANADSKFAQINWNATQLYNEELTENGSTGELDVDIIRVTSTTARATVRVTLGTGETASATYTAMTSLDFTISNYLTLNCQSDNDADLVAKFAYAEYIPAPVVKTPTDVSSLWAYFESDSYSQTDASNITTNWTDLSGNGRTGTVNGTPTFETNELNGLPIIRLGADSNDYFEFPTMAALTAGSIIKVMKVTTETSGGDQFGTAGSGSLYPYTVDHLIYDGFGSTTRKDSLTPNSALSSWHSVYKYSKASDWAIYQNGNLIYHTGTNTVAFSSAPRVGTNGSYYEKCDLAAVYIFNAKLTQGQLNIMYRYIFEKYGI